MTVAMLQSAFPGLRYKREEIIMGQPATLVSNVPFPGSELQEEAKSREG